MSSKQNDVAIGIDLGTTYCCVGAYHRGQIQIIKNFNGDKLTPSYVAISPGGRTIIGKKAKLGKFYNFYDVKRILGRRWEDKHLQEDIKDWKFDIANENGVPKLVSGNRNYYPEQVSARLLKQLKEDAKKVIGKEVTKAVITVPAYFTDGQKQATVDAGMIAGLDVLEILNEPIAASIAYKYQRIHDGPKKVLIYNLGGGSFDVAVLELLDNEIKVLAIDGDTHLGGLDFDKSLLDYCVKAHQTRTGINLFVSKNNEIKRLRNLIEVKKQELSEAAKTDVELSMPRGANLNVTVSRSTFESLNRNLFEKTFEIVDKALATAKLSKTEINDIVMVGGSTNIPKIRSMLQNHFNGKALYHKIDPDEAVAYGAAVRAAMLCGRPEYQNVAIREVAVMSIGVDLYDGSFVVIIPKGEDIRKSFTHSTFKTIRDNQTEVNFQIYQGEDKVAKNNEWLGQFKIVGIPPNVTGAEKLIVTMKLDNGILKVEAKSASRPEYTRHISVKADKGRLSESVRKKLMDEVNSEYSYQDSYDDDDANDWKY